MSNEVAELLDSLYEGNITLDVVAERFRRRSWPKRAGSNPRSFLDIAAADQEDPDPYVPGSYDDVVAAYDQGKLTDAQYAVLAEAIAEADRTDSEEA